MATIFGVNALFFAVLVGFLVSSIYLTWQNIALKMRLSRFEKKLDQVIKSQTFVNESTMGLGQRLIALEGKVKKLKAGNDALTFGSDDFAFSQAVQLFDQGADVDTVVNSCGLSSSEASLMALIRSQMSSKKEAPQTKEQGNKARYKQSLAAGLQ